MTDSSNAKTMVEEKEQPLAVDRADRERPDVPTLVQFFFGTAVPIGATCLYLAHVRDRLLAAERRIRLPAWQLRQILPDNA